MSSKRHKRAEKDLEAAAGDAQKDRAVPAGVPADDAAEKGQAVSADDYRDKYLRAHAEIENIRKRLAKEREEFVKFANESIMTELLYVVDNFDRAIDHMGASQKVESVIEGIKLIQKQFHDLMEKNGVTKIDAVGKRFDPHLHEAVSRVEDDDKEDETVVDEVQAGYLINGRVLRPAVVRISRKTGEGPAGPGIDHAPGTGNDQGPDHA